MRELRTLERVFRSSQSLAHKISDWNTDQVQSELLEKRATERVFSSSQSFEKEE